MRGLMWSPFDPAAGGPGYLYVKLADYLTAKIDDGTLAPGAMLRCERSLAAEHHVSVGTVRRATQLLRQRGLVITLPSRGTYVAAAHGKAGRTGATGRSEPLTE